ncbi:MAG: hypothetical protein PUD55_07525 [Firmicutes bacterium]|nr:hypothetical protein [Bacillota bacterium]
MADLFDYKCPNCGSPLQFDSGVQQLKCPYCGSEIDVEAMNDQELQLGVKEDNLAWEDIACNTWEPGETDDMVVYSCNNCGGEIVVDQSTAATKCPYCDSPVVMKGNFEGDLKPDYVIPFKISKEQAKQQYLKHLEGKKFLPKIFKDRNHIDEMKALYVPFWLFDCEAGAAVRYEAVRTTAWSDNRYNYVKTDHYSVIREGSVEFSRVPVDGSLAMPDELVQSVEPYNFAEAVDFKTAYLAGYLADKYTLSVQDAVQYANSRVKSSTECEFRSTVQGYASVVPRESYVNIKNGKSKYAMYPLWVLNTTFNGEHFIFSINGQTGKTAGDLPVDKGAYWRYFAKITAISTAIIAAIEAVMFIL